MAAKQVCRLCLCREDTVLYKIHDDTSSCTLEISLVLKITKCVGIHVTPRDGFPQYICHHCLYKIDSFFKFKCLCEASDKLLKSDCGKNNNLTPPRKSLRKRKRNIICSKSLPESSEEEINEFQEEPTVFMINENSEPSENLPDPLAISDNEINSKQQEIMVTELPSAFGLADVKIIDNSSNVLHPFEYSSQNSFTLSVNNSMETTINSKSTFDTSLKPKCKSVKKRKRFASKKKVKKGVVDIEPEIRKQRKHYKLFENALSKFPKKQVQCPVCDQLCLPRGYKSHMRIHKLSKENNKKYICWICRKGFTVRYSLKRHMITHTLNKPFKCTKCDRRFSDNSNCIKHERNHNNERPYTCNFCDVRFADNSYLLKHVRSKHSRRSVKIVVPSVDHECYTKKFIDPVHEKFETNWQKVHRLRNASCRKRKKTSNAATDCNVEVTENVQNILKCEETTETFEYMRVQDSFSDLVEDSTDAEQIEYPTNEAPQELEKQQKMDSGQQTYVCQLCNKHFRNEVNLEYHLLAHFE